MNILRFKRAHLAIAIMCFFSYSTSSNVIHDGIQQLNKIDTAVSMNSDLLYKNYVSPEASQKMIALPEKKLQRGEYYSSNNTQNLAQQLTKGLQSLSQNQHPKVYSYSTRTQRFSQQKREVIGQQQEEKYNLIHRSKNYILKKALIWVELLAIYV
ncbi:MAG: hypothetical protein P8I03_12560 [Thalassotalea sp.]|nr:hypothetical protein [Thalassotalea sp.]